MNYEETSRRLTEEILTLRDLEPAHIQARIASALAGAYNAALEDAASLKDTYQGWVKNVVKADAILALKMRI